MYLYQRNSKGQADTPARTLGPTASLFHCRSDIILRRSVVCRHSSEASPNFRFILCSGKGPPAFQVANDADGAQPRRRVLPEHSARACSTCPLPSTRARSTCPSPFIHTLIFFSPPSTSTSFSPSPVLLLLFFLCLSLLYLSFYLCIHLYDV